MEEKMCLAMGCKATALPSRLYCGLHRKGRAKTAAKKAAKKAAPKKAG